MKKTRIYDKIRQNIQKKLVIIYNEEVIKMLEKIDELKRRTIDILDKTKKDKIKYAEERKRVDKYFVESSKANNLKEWEEFLIAFEKILKGE